MTGDYLWDRSGVPDPEVVRLERVLGTLAAPDASAPDLSFARTAPRRRRAFVMAGAMTALAASVLLIIGFPRRAVNSAGPAFQVTRLEGTPTIASRPIVDQGELHAGSWLETDSQAKATIEVASVGRIEIEPGTRIGLLTNRATQHRLQLTQGTIHAFIWAPPGRFVVDTPASTAVDLGCAYTLTVDAAGIGHVKVTTGWVGFEWKGRESFIPAGASCRTYPGLGPGTPYFDDTSARFQAAIEELDLSRGSAETRQAELDRVLADARARDGVTLWHLLSRGDPSQRGRVFDRLSEFVPPPAGVTRAGVLAGQRQMLDDWWDALGLGGANWWRVWKQQWWDAKRP